MRKMIDRTAKASPRFKARMAGVFYLLTSLTSVLAESFIPGKLIIHGNAANTANNIMAHQLLFQVAFGSMIIAVVCSVVLTVLFYELFRPVNKTLSITAAFVHLVGLAILALSGLLLLAPIVVLSGGQYLSVFKADQLQALAYLFLQLNVQAWNCFIAFFGFYCVMIGYLIFRSAFMPRIIGILMMFAGLGYLSFLLPMLADSLAPYNLAPAAFGELSLMLWLLIKGVNVQRWEEQANEAGTSRY
jgi:hypothetical protein